VISSCSRWTLAHGGRCTNYICNWNRKFLTLISDTHTYIHFWLLTLLAVVKHFSAASNIFSFRFSNISNISRLRLSVSCRQTVYDGVKEIQYNSEGWHTRLCFPSQCKMECNRNIQVLGCYLTSVKTSNELPRNSIITAMYLLTWINCNWDYTTATLLHNALGRNKQFQHYTCRNTVFTWS
jgi:hypothetical protein